MRAGPRFFLGCGFAVLLTLVGCGRSSMWQGDRAAWRAQAESQCMQSGAVKIGGGVVRIEPIEGPGVCGADFPLKVAALGESGASYGYADSPPRPPGGVGRDMPDWPGNQPRASSPAPQAAAAPQQNYLPPPDSSQMRWMQGPAPVNAPETNTSYQAVPQRVAPQVSAPQTYRPSGYQQPAAQPSYNAPSYNAPRGYEPRPADNAPASGAPMSIYAPGVTTPRDDIPDDAVLPNGRRPSAQPQPQPPAMPQPDQRSTYSPPPLGPSRDSQFGPPMKMAAVTPVTVTPAATLSCPIVSALDRWIVGGVQPAALHWFGSPVVEMKQISAYSCRGMNGSGGHGISEHAFGNAMDIAAFTLADGRKISVQKSFRDGTPEEQGFLHDVQLFACETFTTVLAPGYNAAHYNHIHVDLMRRASGRRPCRPDAVPGEVVAAKARAVYAARRGGKEYTGSIGDRDLLKKLIDAIPGADGLDDEDDDDVVTGSIGGDDTTGSIPEKPRGWPVLGKARAAITTKSPGDF